jgi:hypothetical protein
VNPQFVETSCPCSIRSAKCKSGLDLVFHSILRELDLLSRQSTSLIFPVLSVYSYKSVSFPATPSHLNLAGYLMRTVPQGVQFVPWKYMHRNKNSARPSRPAVDMMSPSQRAQHRRKIQCMLRISKVKNTRQRNRRAHPTTVRGEDRAVSNVFLCSSFGVS